MKPEVVCEKASVDYKHRGCAVSNQFINVVRQESLTALFESNLNPINPDYAKKVLSFRLGDHDPMPIMKFLKRIPENLAPLLYYAINNIDSIDATVEYYLIYNICKLGVEMAGRAVDLGADLTGMFNQSLDISVVQTDIEKLYLSLGITLSLKDIEKIIDALKFLVPEDKTLREYFELIINKLPSGMTVFLFVEFLRNFSDQRTRLKYDLADDDKFKKFISSCMDDFCGIPEYDSADKYIQKYKSILEAKLNCALPIEDIIKTAADDNKKINLSFSSAADSRGMLSLSAEAKVPFSVISLKIGGGMTLINSPIFNNSDAGTIDRPNLSGSGYNLSAAVNRKQSFGDFGSSLFALGGSYDSQEMHYSLSYKDEETGLPIDYERDMAAATTKLTFGFQHEKIFRWNKNNKPSALAPSFSLYVNPYLSRSFLGVNTEVTLKGAFGSFAPFISFKFSRDADGAKINEAYLNQGEELLANSSDLDSPYIELSVSGGNVFSINDSHRLALNGNFEKTIYSNDTGYVSSSFFLAYVPRVTSKFGTVDFMIGGGLTLSKQPESKAASGFNVLTGFTYTPPIK